MVYGEKSGCWNMSKKAENNSNSTSHPSFFCLGSKRKMHRCHTSTVLSVTEWRYPWVFGAYVVKFDLFFAVLFLKKYQTVKEGRIQKKCLEEREYFLYKHFTGISIGVI